MHIRYSGLQLHLWQRGESPLHSSMLTAHTPRKFNKYTIIVKGGQMGLVYKGIPTIGGIRTWTYQVGSYQLTTSVQSINEGLQFGITLVTEGVPAGTTVPYTITGVTSDDLYGAPLTGNFVVGTNDTITFLTSQDFVTEGPEYVTITLDNGRGSAEILVNDTTTEFDPRRNTQGTVLLLTGEDFGTANPLTFTDTGPNNTSFTMQGSGSYVRDIDLYTDDFSLIFNGTQYLAFNASTAYNIGTQDASVELFVRFNAVPTAFQSLCGQNSGAGTTLRHGAAANGRLCAHVNGDSGVIFGPAIVVGKWYHCLLTYSAQEQTVRYFVDSILYVVKTGVASIPARNEAYYIGNELGDPIYGLNGRISNFRYDVGAIPAEYRTQTTVVGQVVYQVPTARLSATSNTVLLTGATPYVEDVSSYRHQHTGTCGTTGFGPFTRSERYQYGVAAFNGASMIYNDASTAVNFGTGAYTVETSIYFNELVTGASQHDVILASSHAKGGFQIYKRDTTNDIVFGSILISEYVIIPSAEIKVGRWYHIAIVRESTAANKTRVYVNGRLRYTYTDTNNYNVNGICIGGYKSLVYFPGLMGPTRIVKGAALHSTDYTPAPLSAVPGTSLLLNYENLGITDKSQGRYPITNTWGALPSTAEKKWGDRSIYFNGASRLDIPYFNEHYLPGDFTIEFWMNPTVPGDVVDILSFGGGLNVAWSSYYVGQDNLGILFGASFTNTQSEIYMRMPNSITQGEWCHVAITRSGNTWRGYVNGIKLAEMVKAGTPYNPTPRGLQIGAACQTTWGSAPFAGYIGYIDDLRITRGSAIYTATVFAPPERLPTK